MGDIAIRAYQLGAVLLHQTVAPEMGTLRPQGVGGLCIFERNAKQAVHKRCYTFRCRSSRTRTTVPSRIRRMIGSSVSERAFQASQSLFTLRQVRLTVSLPTVPPNKAARARRTRRVLVP